MRYYALPEQELQKVYALQVFMNSPFGMKLTLIRSGTLSMEIHPSQLKLVNKNKLKKKLMEKESKVQSIVIFKYFICS